MNFKGKKIFNMSFHHQIKPFDTISFILVVSIGINDTFFSVPLEFINLSLPSLNKGLKNNKNKLLYQN